MSRLAARIRKLAAAPGGRAALIEALRVDPGLLTKWCDANKPVEPSRRYLIRLGLEEARRAKAAPDDIAVIIAQWLALAKAPVHPLEPSDQELAELGIAPRKQIISRVLSRQMIFCSVVFQQRESDSMEILRSQMARDQFASAIDRGARWVVLTAFDSQYAESETKRAPAVVTSRHLPGAVFGYLTAISRILAGNRRKGSTDLVERFRQQLRFAILPLPAGYPEDFYGFCKPRYRLVYGINVNGEPGHLLDHWPTDTLSLMSDTAEAFEQHDGLCTLDGRTLNDVIGVVERSERGELQRFRDWLRTLSRRVLCYRMSRNIRSSDTLLALLREPDAAVLEASPDKPARRSS